MKPHTAASSREPCLLVTSQQRRALLVDGLGSSHDLRHVVLTGTASGTRIGGLGCEKRIGRGTGSDKQTFSQCPAA